MRYAGNLDTTNYNAGKANLCKAMAEYMELAPAIIPNTCTYLVRRPVQRSDSA